MRMQQAMEIQRRVEMRRRKQANGEVTIIVKLMAVDGRGVDGSFCSKILCTDCWCCATLDDGGRYDKTVELFSYIQTYCTANLNYSFCVDFGDSVHCQLVLPRKSEVQRRRNSPGFLRNWKGLLQLEFEPPTAHSNPEFSLSS